jgi:hypothetical protein
MAIRDDEYSTSDLDEAKERVFRHMLSKAWQDEAISEKELDVLKWVRERLELDVARAGELNREFARNQFAFALARAMEDGFIDAREEQRLQKIAAGAGHSLAQFARSFFQNESESFLRALFAAAVHDNCLAPEEWNNLQRTTSQLGLSHSELLVAIAPQARMFVEHVLADAKADARLSPAEDKVLQWLTDCLIAAPGYRQYVADELAYLRLLTSVEDGHLPSITPPQGVEIRAGEIVHHAGDAILRQFKQTRQGTHCQQHEGLLMLTDNRFVFSSASKSESTNYRKVVSHRGCPSWFEVHVDKRPIQTFVLRQPSALPYAIFRSAVAMAFQTKLAMSSDLPTRHIPRDVRQRVWQKYAGRCADCSATDYLEFDHIIPVAKGGSNSDSNVQLLCRRCNQKKSDNI